MSSIQIKSKFIALSLFLAFGCDKVCKTSVQDFATVQNMTGRQLTLNVCKGKSYGEVQSTASPGAASQELNLGTHEGTEIQGGMDALKNCSAPNTRMEMGFTLAPSSYGQVRLCYNESTKIHVVVENIQTCPVGYSEQTTSEACKTGVPY